MVARHQDLAEVRAQLPPARRADMAVFIQHFERITRHMLAGGVRADVTITLDRQRRPFSP